MNFHSPTVESIENDTAVVGDAPNVAIPVGTVFGLQLPMVLKSPVGVPFPTQVASAATAGTMAGSDIAVPTSSARIQRARPRLRLSIERMPYLRVNPNHSQCATGFSQRKGTSHPRNRSTGGGRNVFIWS